MKAHLLFEQSGTFKNQFKQLGIEAFDYDILNDFGETDFCVDLFEEIDRGGRCEPSIFDRIGLDDITIAFFPCTMFQENNALWFSGKAYQMKNYTLSQKMDICIKRHDDLNVFYKKLCALVKLYVDRGLKLIIENPATSPNYLKTYWIEPSLTDSDRRENGDYYKKPTNFWFIGVEPKNNFLFEPIEFVEQRRIIYTTKGNTGLNRTVARSMIHPQYANRFIRQYIL